MVGLPNVFALVTVAGKEYAGDGLDEAHFIIALKPNARSLIVFVIRDHNIVLPVLQKIIACCWPGKLSEHRGFREIVN